MSIKNFFYKEDDFQPPYLYMALFNFSGFLSFVLGSFKIIPIDFASTGMTIFIAAGQALAGFYNWNEHNKLKAESKS